MYSDIKLLIPDSHKSTALQATAFVLKHPKMLSTFIEFAFTETPQYSMRAANVIEHCDNYNPLIIKPYLKNIVTKLPTLKIDGVKRCFLKLCSDKDFSTNENLQIILLNTCFDWLNNKNEGIAVKVYSIIILYNISNYIPDIKQELVASIEYILPEASPAIQVVGKRYLKKLY